MILTITIFLLIAVLTGILGSLVGIGGGLFFVPTLLYFGNQFEPGSVTPQVASGTSLMVVAVTALSSTLAYLKQKKVDIQTAWLFFAASAPGAVAGVYVNKLFELQVFYLLLGLFQISMFFLLTFRDKIKPRKIKLDVTRTYVNEDGVEHEYGYKRWIALLVAFFVGLISSLFGIGGGALLVPVMIALFRFPPHVATATSMFIIFLSAIVGSATNLINGHIDWFYVLLLAPGAWVGGMIGAMVASRLRGKTLVLLLRLLIVVIAVQMIWKSMTF